MNKSLLPGRELHRGETIAVNGDRRGVKLRCLSGRVWITQPGDGTDYLLGAGREFMVTRAGKVVIQALTDLAEVAA
jgi:hypothetical protein